MVLHVSTDNVLLNGGLTKLLLGNMFTIRTFVLGILLLQCNIMLTIVQHILYNQRLVFYFNCNIINFDFECTTHTFTHIDLWLFYRLWPGSHRFYLNQNVMFRTSTHTHTFWITNFNETTLPYLEFKFKLSRNNHLQTDNAACVSECVEYSGAGYYYFRCIIKIVGRKSHMKFTYYSILICGVV